MPGVSVEDQARAAGDPVTQLAEGTRRAKGLGRLDREMDAAGEVGLHQVTTVVSVDGDRGSHGAGPAHGQVDQRDVVNRTESLRSQPSERPEAGARSGGQHDGRQRFDSWQTRAMESRRWLNQSQPQTLQVAVFLLYLNGIFALLFGGLFYAFGLVIIVGSVAAAYGIANERKWGYGLGVAMAFLPFALAIANGVSLLGGGILNLLFEVALVALLLHPQSRDYQRIWFK